MPSSPLGRKGCAGKAACALVYIPSYSPAGVCYKQPSTLPLLARGLALGDRALPLCRVERHVADRAAEQQLREDAPDRPNVIRRPVPLANGLFGRHVGVGAHLGLGARATGG